MTSPSIVYVVTWDSPEGVGGFEWNVSREAAETSISLSTRRSGATRGR
jgi:hypothetical protein